MKYSAWIIILIFALIATSLMGSIQVIDKNGTVTTFSYAQLSKINQIDFQATHSKNGKETTDSYRGFDFKDFLNSNKFTDFQTIRFESEDNYMVRIHKADLDTMPAFIALYKDAAVLDSSQIRLVLPKLREMNWMWGVSHIYLEDFKPMPKPRQILMMGTELKLYKLMDDPPPFKDIKGYKLDEILENSLYNQEGSVVFYCRDGLKSRLEYPKHLKGAVIEVTADGKYNLKCPLIPAGMWLKDVVFIQAGVVSLLANNYLPELSTIYKALDWQYDPAKPDRWLVRSETKPTKSYSLEEIQLYNLKPGDWLELAK